MNYEHFKQRAKYPPKIDNTLHVEAVWHLDARPSIRTSLSVDIRYKPDNSAVNFRHIPPTVPELDDYNPPSQWRWRRKTVRHRTVDYEPLFFGNIPNIKHKEGVK